MQRTKRLQARSPWGNNLNLKRRKPRCGDRVQFQVMPWFFRDKQIYEGTIVDIRTSESWGDTRYYVDTVVGGQHLDDAMILGRELVGIMETRPHAHRKRVSRRRLKVYQRRKSHEDWCKNPPQLTTLNALTYTADLMLSSLGSGIMTIDWTEIKQIEGVRYE